MAIKSIKELPKGKQATTRQIDTAKKAKAITVKAKNLGIKRGRLRFDLGLQPKQNVAGIVKGFRQKYESDFGTVLLDKDNNVIGRTHVASGRRTVAEQLAVKAISKYAKTIDDVRIIAIVPVSQFHKEKRKSTKKAAKTPAKKAAKKATKKITKAPAKKAPAKKAPAKKAPAKKKAVKKVTKKAAKKTSKKGKRK